MMCINTVDTPIAIMPASLGLADVGYSSRGADIRIAILDGPVHWSHPALRGANLRQLHIDGTDDSEQFDENASLHGTQIASILFGQRDSSVVGLAPTCQGVLIPVFRQGGRCSQLDLARAIGLAQEQGCHIINISGGSPITESDQAHPLLAESIRRCADAGVAIVAAAGNEGCQCVHIPASIECVLAVGAMGVNQQPLQMTNWGRSYQSHGVLALGENLLTATPPDGTAGATGTSYATAVVSGLLAQLLLSQSGAPDPKAARHAILATAVACPRDFPDDCQRYLAGGIDIQAAMQFIRNRKRVSTLDLATMAFYKNDEDQMNSNARLDEVHESNEPQPLVASQTIVTPSGANAPCNCPTNVSSPQLVFALGEFAFTYGSEARRDGFRQLLGGDPDDPEKMLAHLETHPWDAASIIWTLNLESIPIYVLQPVGPFAATAYLRFQELLYAQLTGDVKHVSIAGTIRGSVKLPNGNELPMLHPDLRGVFGWRLTQLLKDLFADSAAESEQDQQERLDVRNFLNRVYYELRNLGVTPADRAVNFAATNAFQARTAFHQAIRSGLKLDKISVQKSPICQLNSDCWDVTMTFFNPERRLEVAVLAERFTVDVSDVVPVTVGDVRSWYVY